MYNINDIYRKESNEDLEVIENIFLKPNSISENIKEAILEMNIMRQTTISTKTLHDFVNQYKSESN